jgi:hypothetical protein
MCPALLLVIVPKSPAAAAAAAAKLNATLEGGMCSCMAAGMLVIPTNDCTLNRHISLTTAPTYSISTGTFSTPEPLVYYVQLNPAPS